MSQHSYYLKFFDNKSIKIMAVGSMYQINEYIVKIYDEKRKFSLQFIGC